MVGPLQLPQVAVELEKDLLRSVLGVFQIAQQAERGGQHQALVLPHERLESG